MAFLTGKLIIDAPASALNNLGNIPGARTDNTSGVKMIRTKEGPYPYVSAQAFRYWLRTTLENSNLGWQAAPVYREEKIAYTDANPIKYWDDDLFGYMRAPSKRTKEKIKHEGSTEITDTITRVSPFRVGTLVSIAPVNIINDYGVMARQEGDPVPFEHQFYCAVLKGLFSLNFKSSGTFWYKKKTGFKNLDEARIKCAEESGLEHLKDEKAYRLSKEERIKRITTLLEGLAMLEGGAKLAIHYTDVAPDVIIVAVTRGGNHIFKHILGSDEKGLLYFNEQAMKQVINVFRDEILSDIYFGWVEGYCNEELNRVKAFADKQKDIKIVIDHPREVLKGIVKDMEKTDNYQWLD